MNNNNEFIEDSMNTLPSAPPMPVEMAEALGMNPTGSYGSVELSPTTSFSSVRAEDSAYGQTGIVDPLQPRINTVDASTSPINLEMNTNTTIRSHPILPVSRMGTFESTDSSDDSSDDLMLQSCKRAGANPLELIIGAGAAAGAAWNGLPEEARKAATIGISAGVKALADKFKNGGAKPGGAPGIEIPDLNLRQGYAEFTATDNHSVPGALATYIASGGVLGMLQFFNQLRSNGNWWINLWYCLKVGSYGPLVMAITKATQMDEGLEIIEQGREALQAANERTPSVGYFGRPILRFVGGVFAFLTPPVLHWFPLAVAGSVDDFVVSRKTPVKFVPTALGYAIAMLLQSERVVLGYWLSGIVAGVIFYYLLRNYAYSERNGSSGTLATISVNLKFISFEFTGNRLIINIAMILASVYVGNFVGALFGVAAARTIETQGWEGARQAEEVARQNISPETKPDGLVSGASPQVVEAEITTDSPRLKDRRASSPGSLKGPSSSSFVAPKPISEVTSGRKK